MKFARILFGMSVLCFLSGCSMYDGLFSVFGKNYSGGGTTRTEKRADYEAQQEAWQGLNTERAIDKLHQDDIKRMTEE
jgi:hypothetical protein